MWLNTGNPPAERGLKLLSLSDLGLRPNAENLGPLDLSVDGRDHLDADRAMAVRRLGHVFVLPSPLFHGHGLTGARGLECRRIPDRGVAHLVSAVVVVGVLRALRVERVTDGVAGLSADSAADCAAQNGTKVPVLVGGLADRRSAAAADGTTGNAADLAAGAADLEEGGTQDEHKRDDTLHGSTPIFFPRSS